MNGLGKTARNERTKLKATTFNAVGLEFSAMGVIQPAVIGTVTVDGAVKLLPGAMLTYILNRHAMRLLETLED